MGVIDHVNLPVSDLKRSKPFYDAVTAALGLELFAADDEAAGYGNGNWNFGIVQSDSPIPAMHLAFEASSRDAVDAFYRAAINAGGKDNGPPGVRPAYHDAYYAAFALDPDGHNIEAVFRG